MSDQDNETRHDSREDKQGGRPDWLWKVIVIIAALVLLQVVIVWYFWVRL